jgi:lipoprotein-anchoring transpeptidase ErfK/SrfK
MMRRDFRRIYPIGAAVALLLIGGSGVAAIGLTRPTPKQHPVAATVATAADPDRIMLSPASVEQAYAVGTIDRPIRSVLNVPQRMRYGDYRWYEKGVASAGPIWVRVDLKSQIISVFRGGDEIGTAVILYGADGVPTPTGKFPILAKLKDHRSASYDAPMPYTLRLTGDGVSIHASNVRWGYATHGCIGVPEGFAAKLFAAASVGDQVTITRAG